MSTSSTPATPAPKKSVLSKIGGFFKHMFSFFDSDAASFEHTASTTIALISPLVNTLVALTADSSIASKVAGVVGQVVTDLNNTAAMLTGGEAGSAEHTILGFLQGVQTNLGTLLADADVKNSAKAAEITGVVNTVLGEVEAIVQAIPTGHSVPVVGTTSAS
jgi:hypothetical protein